MTPTEFEHDHTPEAIAKRLSRQPTPSYVRDFVYGGIDGAITTFAIVAGVEGADRRDRGAHIRCLFEIAKSRLPECVRGRSRWHSFGRCQDQVGGTVWRIIPTFRNVRHAAKIDANAQQG